MKTFQFFVFLATIILLITSFSFLSSELSKAQQEVEFLKKESSLILAREKSSCDRLILWYEQCLDGRSCKQDIGDAPVYRTVAFPPVHTLTSQDSWSKWFEQELSRLEAEKMLEENK